MTAAACQDLTGWTEFLHRKKLVDIEAIQQLQCSLQPCRITGPDWMKAMSYHLMQILHSKSIFWNFTLHDKQRGYLRLMQRRELLREVDSLLNTLPEDIPVESQYLLELNFSTLYNVSFERQAYWTLAMKAHAELGSTQRYHTNGKEVQNATGLLIADRVNCGMTSPAMMTR